jgi:hypothetical protein
MLQVNESLQFKWSFMIRTIKLATLCSRASRWVSLSESDICLRFTRSGPPSRNSRSAMIMQRPESLRHTDKLDTTNRLPCLWTYQCPNSTKTSQEWYTRIKQEWDEYEVVEKYEVWDMWMSSNTPLFIDLFLFFLNLWNLKWHEIENVSCQQADGTILVVESVSTIKAINDIQFRYQRESRRVGV